MTHEARSSGKTPPRSGQDRRAREESGHSVDLASYVRQWPRAAHGREASAEAEPLVTATSVAQSRTPTLRRDWELLLRRSDNLYALYQSPEWFDHLCTDPDSGVLPPVVAHRAGQTLAVVPLTRSARELRIGVRTRTLWRSRLRTVSVLGSQPLLHGGERLYDRIFATVAEAAPEADAIYLHSVPTDSALWRHLEGAAPRSRFLVHLPDGIRPFHSLALPDSFDAYLAKFAHKKRYNLRRQLRLLGEQHGGPARARRVVSPADVPAFVDAARHVTARCRLGTRDDSRLARALRAPATLVDQARRGLLRAYVLDCGAAPCAIVLGYQYGRVYHYAEVAYDGALAALSPGAGLLYLLIEDLIAERPPAAVNFGIGSAQYKREFGNVERRDASVLLLRRTLPNAARVRVHAGLGMLLRAAKRAAARARR
jgi:CelD/BcsL family acetyltransferase involved in cellulose biosynthesis